MSAALLPQHQALLDASGIAPEVAEARGYRSVERKCELRELGFGVNQARTPTLLIPIFGVTGSIELYQSRPDEPRIGANGKPVKYETPAGARMTLDVPPRCRSERWLGTPDRPLFITEGVRKADAGVSRGMCTVAMLGVWNFRGTNDQGGKTALPAWESIHLKGRAVYVVFDSDVTLKEAVHAALTRLVSFLRSRGANVRIVYLPCGEGGAKVGLDDFLVAGGDPQQLLRLAEDDVRRSPAPDASRACATFFTESGSTYWNKAHSDSVTAVRLANFTAQIVERVILDDGAAKRSFVVVRGAVLGEPFEVQVSARDFSSMHWVESAVGPHAIVAAGIGIRDRLREAIQTLSAQPIPVRQEYGHLGWIERAGHSVFVHAGGGIGAEGQVEDLCVRLPEQLSRFRLPPPPRGAARVEAVRASLGLLDGLAPDTVMFPLFSFAYAPPLCTPQEGVHITGRTGTRKTELAARVQQHYGEEMDAQRLPLGWSGTANAIEAVGTAAKDCVLTVDDYCPVGDARDVQAAERVADRVIRGHGNRRGRERLSADGSLQASRAFEGGLLSTGEEVPSTHSLRARLLVVDLAPGEVDLARLSVLQRQGAQFALSMAAFIEFLAPLRASVKRWFCTEQPRLRAELIPIAAHGRSANGISEQLLTLHFVLDFALRVGAITEPELKELWGRGVRAMAELLRRQTDHQEHADPVEWFLRSLRDALLAGRVRLDRRPSRKSQHPSQSRSDDDIPAANNALLVGWRDDERDEAFLIPEAAYQAVFGFSIHSPSRITIGSKTLFQRLQEGGHLIEHEPGRNTVKVRFGKRTHNLLKLRLEGVCSGTGTSGTELNPRPPGSLDPEQLYARIRPSPARAVGGAPSADRPTAGTQELLFGKRSDDVSVAEGH